MYIPKSTCNKVTQLANGLRALNTIIGRANIYLKSEKAVATRVSRLHAIVRQLTDSI